MVTALGAVAHRAGAVQDQNHRRVGGGDGLIELLLGLDLQGDQELIFVVCACNGLGNRHIAACGGILSGPRCFVSDSLVLRNIVQVIPGGVLHDLITATLAQCESRSGQQAQGHDQSQQQRQYTFLRFCHFSFSFLCRGTKYLAVGRAWRFRFSFLTLRPALSDGLPFHYFLFRWRGALSPRSVLKT